jgi:hypothetical protein
MFRLFGTSITRRQKSGYRSQPRPITGIAHNKVICRLEVANRKEPKRPWRLLTAGNGSMCAEQRLDYEAACDGKMSWSVYFAKWGPRL